MATEMSDIYNNPYNTYSECKKYRLYYYAYTKKSLNHHDCIKYANCEEYRASIKCYPNKRKPYKTNEEPLTQADYDHFNSLYDYDKEGIVKKDEWYIFYVDKIYSISQNKYLIPKESTKYGKHCRLFSGTHKHEIYKLKDKQSNFVKK